MGTITRVLVEATRRLSPNEHILTVPDNIIQVWPDANEQPVHNHIDWYFPPEPGEYGKNRVVRFVQDNGIETPQIVDKIIIHGVGYRVVLETTRTVDSCDARSEIVLAEARNSGAMPVLSKARRNFAVTFEDGCLLYLSLDYVFGLAAKYGERFLKISYTLPEPINGQLQQILEHAQVAGSLEEGEHRLLWGIGGNATEVAHVLMGHDPQVVSYRQMLVESLAEKAAAKQTVSSGQASGNAGASTRTNAIAWMERQPR